MKKVFALLLVGVVAISMFGFVAPMNVSANNTNSRGTIKFINKGAYVSFLRGYFYDKNGSRIGNISTKRICAKNEVKVDIPVNASTIVLWPRCSTFKMEGIPVKYKKKDVIKLKAKQEVSSHNEITIKTCGTLLIKRHAEVSLPKNGDWEFT